jgi:uncharacterized protein (UPF0147 family)
MSRLTRSEYDVKVRASDVLAIIDEMRRERGADDGFSPWAIRELERKVVAGGGK